VLARSDSLDPPDGGCACPKAPEWLEVDAGLMFVGFDWVFRNLWTEPRWKAFLKRMNLPVD
jgi:hypothetical protein